MGVNMQIKSFHLATLKLKSLGIDSVVTKVTKKIFFYNFLIIG